MENNIDFDAIRKEAIDTIDNSSIDFEAIRSEAKGINRPYTPETQQALGSFGISDQQPKYNFDLDPIELQNPETPTSILTIATTGILKHPKDKINMYAKSRGISPNQYFITSDGDIAFEDDEGNIYREESYGVGPWLKKTGIEMATDPATYIAPGAGLGARLGLKAARPLIRKGGVLAAETVGGALGQIGKQEIAKREYGEDLSTGERVADVGLGVAMGLGIEGGMRGAKTAIDIPISYLAQEKGVGQEVAKVLNNAGLFDKKNINKVIETDKLANNFGIDLNILEKADSAKATSILKKIVKEPESQKIAEERALDLLTKVPDFIKRTIGTKEYNPSLQVRNAVTEKLKDDSELIRNITRPFYEQAFAKNSLIDTTSAIEYIKNNFTDLKNTTTAQRSVGKRLLKEFSSPEKVEKIKTISSIYEKPSYVKKMEESGTSTEWLSKYYGPKDVLTTETENTKTITLRKLDSLKKDIDQKLSPLYTENGSSLSKSNVEKLKELRKILIELGDNSSSEYKNARLVHALLTEGTSKVSSDVKQELVAFGIKGDQINESKEILSKISESDLKDIGGYLLSTNKSSPEVVNAVKKVVNEKFPNNGEDIWKGIVSDNFILNFNKISSMAGRTRGDIGGEMWNSILGTPQQRAIMEEALPPQQYSNLYQFFNLLRKTGLVVGPNISESTAPKLNEGIISKALNVVKPLYSKWAVGAGLIQHMQTEKGTKALVDLLWDPNAGTRLKEIAEQYQGSKNKALMTREIISLLGWSSGIQSEESIIEQ